MRRTFFITLVLLAQESFLHAGSHPLEMLRDTYSAFEATYIRREGLREIHRVNKFTSGSYYDAFYLLDSAGRITRYSEHFNGKPIVYFSWTYSSDSIPVSAERIDYTVPGTERTAWLFDSTGRTQSVRFSDSTGKLIKTVVLFYDDCLVTAHTTFVLPGAEYMKVSETMDCQGNFTKKSYTGKDSLDFDSKPENALPDEVNIEEYISFPPNRPAERNVISRERIFGGRTVERVYPLESRATRKKLVEKNVISASGKLIKKKVIVRSFGKIYVMRVRFKYNADGLPAQIIIAPAPGRKQAMERMTATIRYVYAQ